MVITTGFRCHHYYIHNMTQQSPIDIDPYAVKEIIMDDYSGHIDLTLGTGPGRFEHGYTNFKVNWSGDATTVLKLRDGREFRPIQFHFHTPSEHTLQGHHFPFCMHLVHQSTDGNLAVVGVFFQVGEDESPFLKQFWNVLPELDPYGVDVTVDNISFDDLYIASTITDEAFYRYQGSLTTPPYTEHVEWILVKDPRTMSKAQLQHFIDILPGGSNARELQPIQDAAGQLLFCCDA
ncbi:hypothetical protein DYB37_003679 [Aphanomyces astaci]|uniref:carbonic anhydrase n=1 Tax=Aphanomyces astaci TaxID=112090 RepID=A0A3R7BXM5_APHAT|nr:hypothetical protein DYB37_003679 [Aphanomyces astaci]